MILAILIGALSHPGISLSGSAPLHPPVPAQSITKRLTRSWSGGEPDAGCFSAACSEDGEVVVFVSTATNLVQNDLNGTWDVFIVRASSGLANRVSVASTGVEANQHSQDGRITADGRYVFFSSLATNLDPRDTNGVFDVFRHDLTSGITVLVSLDPANLTAVSGRLLDVSSDGRFVAMYTDVAWDPADTNGLLDVYVRDQVTGQFQLISRSTAGGSGNAHTNQATISGDGRYLSFESLASNLVASDGNGTSDVFLHDRLLGTTTRISEGPNGVEANGASRTPSISRDSRRVSFGSRATNLVSGSIPPGGEQVLVHELSTGENFYASLRSDGSFGWGENISACISPDGRMIGFMSGVTDIAPGASGYSPALRDSSEGITTIASVNDQGHAGLNLTGGYPVAFSGNGRMVIFNSDAPNLGGGSTSGKHQVYIHDRHSNGPVLHVAPLIGGQNALFSVTGATPGGRLSIGASVSGQGLIATPFGLLHLASPIHRFTGYADSLGNWSQPVRLPFSMSGRQLWTQGVDYIAAEPTTLFRGVVM